MITIVIECPVSEETVLAELSWPEVVADMVTGVNKGHKTVDDSGWKK